MNKKNIIPLTVVLIALLAWLSCFLFYPAATVFAVTCLVIVALWLLFVFIGMILGWGPF